MPIEKENELGMELVRYRGNPYTKLFSFCCCFSQPDSIRCIPLKVEMGSTDNNEGTDRMKLKLTIPQVVAMMQQNVKGAQAVTVDLDSDMDGKGKMRKTGNPFVGQGIVNRMTLNGMVGYIYANAVNRIAAKEGKDERNAKPHPWGDMDEKHLFRIHRKTGEPYLSMMVRSTDVHGFFRPDGSQVADAEIRPFIPEKSVSSTQADLEGEVIARDFALRNIKAIRCMGMDIEVISETEAEEIIGATSQTAAADAVPAPVP